MSDVLDKMEAIREALEKQQLKEPIICTVGQERIEKCPTCNERVIKYEHHCQCGQALNWEGIMTNFDYIKRMNLKSMAFALMLISSDSKQMKTLEDFINWLESDSGEGYIRYGLRI